MDVRPTRTKPAVVEDQVCKLEAVRLGLTFGHRLIDAGPAARSLQRAKQLIQQSLLPSSF